MRKPGLGTLLIGFALLAGCAAGGIEAVTATSLAVPTAQIETPVPTAAPKALPTETIAPTEENPETCPTPYFTTDQPRDHYQLDAFLDTGGHALEVVEKLTYTNRTDIFLEALFLEVEANRSTDAFRLVSLNVGGSSSSAYTLEQHKMVLNLETPLPPGCSVALDAAYTLTLPEQGGIFGYLDNQTVLTNWYLFVPPYHAEYGWLLNAPGSYGEHWAFPYADYDVSLTLNSLEGDPQIAAPARPEVRENTYTYHLEGVRSFSLAVIYDVNTVSQVDDGVTYTVHYQTVSQQAAQTALQTLINSVHLYSELFGPYPYDSLTMTELEMYDGMEFDAQFFLSKKWFGTYDGTPKNNLVLLAAHETAHNWWYSQVGNDQAYDPWLDESLCVYSEVLYLEAYYPNLVDWWWDFRVYNFEPQGPVNVTIYDYVQYEFYRQAVYLRGAEFIQAVRDELGDGDFFNFLQQYLALGQGQVMAPEDFFGLLATFNPQAAESLRAEYFGDW
ncbi:hypothetical protein KQH61_04870 [bacterium]|nr:hypothetical protein [bacterium]MCB2179234.1 hypothetical protein [bacterium]